MAEQNPSHIQILRRHSDKICRSLSEVNVYALANYYESEELISYLEKEKILSQQHGRYEKAVKMFETICVANRRMDESGTVNAVIEGLRTHKLDNYADMIEKDCKLYEQHIVIDTRNQKIKQLKESAQKDQVKIKSLEMQISELMQKNGVLEGKQGEQQSVMKSMQATINQLEVDKKQLQGTITDLKSQLSPAQKTAQSSEESVKMLQLGNVDTAKQLTSLKGQMDEQVMTLEKQIQDQQKTITQLEEQNRILNEKVVNAAAIHTPAQQLHGKAKREKIYIFGGWDDRNGKTAMIREYVAGVGVKVLETVELGQPRWVHNAIVSCLTGEVFVIGGWTSEGVTNCVEVFDKHMTKSRITTPMLQCRDDFACCVIGTKLYVIGGDGPIAKCEYFDLNTETWHGIHDLPLSVSQMSAVPYKNEHNQDIILVFGGASIKNRRFVSDIVYQYDIAKDSWSTRKDLKMPEPLRLYGLVQQGNHVTITGGVNSNNEDTEDTAHCSRVDLSTKQWHSLPDMKYARGRHCAVVCNDKVVVMGGWGMKSVEMLDGQKWVDMPDLDVPLWNAAAVCVSNATADE